jgi:surface antigen
VHISLQSKIVSLAFVVVVAAVLLGGSLGHRNTGVHASGGGNPFPYPSCTWGAAQEYYNLHHVWVPWHTNAMAWQWTDRALQFHWHASTSAHLGAIVNLQPWVQGAYGGGHVEVVIKVYRDGSVLAIGTSWGRNIYAWTPWHLHPGRGVTFLWK